MAALGRFRPLALSYAGRRGTCTAGPAHLDAGPATTSHEAHSAVEGRLSAETHLDMGIEARPRYHVRRRGRRSKQRHKRAPATKLPKMRVTRAAPVD
jgi:hypothetical protein